MSVWLLSGVCASRARAVAMACFTCFFGVSLYQALSGASSCGCFGVPISPWITSAVDFVAVASLWCWAPIDDGPASASPRPARSVGLAGALLLVLAVALSAAYWSKPAHMSDEGEISGSARMVVLEPERWVGKPFPLLKHADV